ncbi:hypothetical protein PIB30_028120 [Stylosanthes scabra]|uniref:Uncharacterized protein n=1 Tax=Stylosanthes scabra TaxID=79078 RepID=A0ABU6U9R4_9FABA|nr:hypothetical protein [Stylosanthes scabra]
MSHVWTKSQTWSKRDLTNIIQGLPSFSPSHVWPSPKLGPNTQLRLHQAPFVTTKSRLVFTMQVTKRNSVKVVPSFSSSLACHVWPSLILEPNVTLPNQDQAHIPSKISRKPRLDQVTTWSERGQDKAHHAHIMSRPRFESLLA